MHRSHIYTGTYIHTHVIKDHDDMLLKYEHTLIAPAPTWWCYNVLLYYRYLLYTYDNYNAKAVHYYY